MTPTIAPEIAALRLYEWRMEHERRAHEPPRPPYAARGGVAQAVASEDAEVVLSGPAGTGKTLGMLEKVHRAALAYPGMRGLLMRKTLTSLAKSALVTFERVVEPGRDGARYFGGSARKPAAYQYPNGSEIVIGGMDKPENVLSAEYDVIYVNQAEELTEGEWEFAKMRLRPFAVQHAQMLGDCNPSAPTHWIRRRVDGRLLTLIESRHQDNPRYWDEAVADWTPEGRSYVLGTLGSLTGVRALRYAKGLWAAAEGLVYEGYDPAIHLIDRFAVPAEWGRLWSIDFGYTDPFVWQEWRIDPDHRLYRTRELLMTQRLVADHALDIAKAVGARINPDAPSGQRIDWTGVPRPQAIVCDHDAEGRATLERELGLSTTKANKPIQEGIQAVAARLRPAGDGRPRLFLVRDALVEVDRRLEEAKTPYATEQEIEGYVWRTPGAEARPKDEVPVDKDNHGLDATRYAVMHLDGSGKYTGWLEFAHTDAARIAGKRYAPLAAPGAGKGSL